MSNGGYSKRWIAMIFKEIEGQLSLPRFFSKVGISYL